MTTPQSIFDLGKLLKDSAGGNALEPMNKFRDLMCWLHLEKYMNMVNVCFNRNDCAFLLSGEQGNDFLYPVAYLHCQNAAPVFYAPNYVIGQDVNRMCAAVRLLLHAYTNGHLLRYVRTLFHPTLKRKLESVFAVDTIHLPHECRSLFVTLDKKNAIFVGHITPNEDGIVFLGKLKKS